MHLLRGTKFLREGGVSAQQASKRNNQSKSEFSPKMPSHIAFCRPGVTDDCTNQFLAKF